MVILLKSNSNTVMKGFYKTGAWLSFSVYQLDMIANHFIFNQYPLTNNILSVSSYYKMVLL